MRLVPTVCVYVRLVPTVCVYVRLVPTVCVCETSTYCMCVCETSTYCMCVCTHSSLFSTRLLDNLPAASVFKNLKTKAVSVLCHRYYRLRKRDWKRDHVRQWSQYIFSVTLLVAP